MKDGEFNRINCNLEALAKELRKLSTTFKQAQVLTVSLQDISNAIVDPHQKRAVVEGNGK